jgi:CubicO group peptidase (beta-lactamase class C family)
MSEAGLAVLRDHFAEKGTQAALVVRRGVIAAEWYWDGADAATQLACYSTTKSVASTAVGFLVDDGSVRLRDSVAKYIPEWRGDAREEITIRHVLSMTSGIKNDGDHLRQAEDRIAHGISQPLVAPPGTVFDYNNCGCAAISPIVRAASGMELAEFLQQRLYGPLGMTGLRHEVHAGKTLPYSGLHITARDAARFGYLFLRRGVWDGRRLLSEAWIDQACRSSQAVNPNYGFLWWVNDQGFWKSLPRDAYSAQGMYSNNVTILPSHDMVVVRLVGDAAENARNKDVSVDAYCALAVAACEA